MQSSGAAPATRAHLAPLTGLRFLAALHVLLYHTAPRTAASNPLALGLLNTGFVGVGLFYVLSGFILSYNYLDVAAARRLDRRSYLAARFARVYPVYALALLIALPIFAQWTITKISTEHAHGLAKVGLSAVANIGLLQAWIPITIPQWNAPGWSLSDEALFYLCFPALAIWIGQLDRRAVSRLLPLVWIAALAAPIVFVLGHPLIGPNGDRGASGLTEIVAYNPLLRLPEFAIGMLVGRLFLTRQAAAADDARPALGAIAIGALVAILAVLALSEPIPTPILHNGLLAPLFATLIFALATGGGALGRFLGSAVMVRLGEASYALYIVHIPIYVYAGWLAKQSGFAVVHPYAFFFAYALATVVISLLILQLVEEPARRAVRRRLTRALAPRDRALIDSGVPADS